MKPIVLFVVTAMVAFWAADLFAFDGVYSAKIWNQGNSYGQEWQHDAKLWFRQHGI
ncbi:MAG TPA: hypothetical protein VLZ74_11115 [Methylocella sp.]|nr:hypothetical protein [Methylocella sp.]